MDMTFTIIMPAYNAERDIVKAIDSVLNQTYKKFQLIVVDDGSTDSTPNIIDNYADNYGIIALHQSNQGIAAAYKTAFSYMKGDYVTFLDSDDYFESNTLETINQALQSNSFDIVQFGINYYNENWQYQRSIVFPAQEKKGNNEIIRDYLKGIIDYSDRPNLGIHAYRVGLFCGADFPSGSLGIDEILNLYAMCRCDRILYLENAFYNCQRRLNSVSRRKPDMKKVLGQLASYELMTNELQKKHMNFIGYHYFRVLKYYAKYSAYIMNSSEFKQYQAKVALYREQIRTLKDIKLPLSVSVRIWLLCKAPILLKAINKIFSLDK